MTPTEEALAEVRAYRAAKFEEMAQACALHDGYSLTALNIRLEHYRGGVLSDSPDASYMRRLYSRALAIAMKHQQKEDAA